VAVYCGDELIVPGLASGSVMTAQLNASGTSETILSYYLSPFCDLSGATPYNTSEAAMTDYALNAMPKVVKAFPAVAEWIPPRIAGEGNEMLDEIHNNPSFLFRNVHLADVLRNKSSVDFLADVPAATDESKVPGYTAWIPDKADDKRLSAGFVSACRSNGLQIKLECVIGNHKDGLFQMLANNALVKIPLELLGFDAVLFDLHLDSPVVLGVLRDKSLYNSCVWHKSIASKVKDEDSGLLRLIIYKMIYLIGGWQRPALAAALQVSCRKFMTETLGSSPSDDTMIVIDTLVEKLSEVGAMQSEDSEEQLELLKTELHRPTVPLLFDVLRVFGRREGFDTPIGRFDHKRLRDTFAYGNSDLFEYPMIGENGEPDPEARSWTDFCFDLLKTGQFPKRSYLNRMFAVVKEYYKFDRECPWCESDAAVFEKNVLNNTDEDSVDRNMIPRRVTTEASAAEVEEVLEFETPEEKQPMMLGAPEEHAIGEPLAFMKGPLRPVPGAPRPEKKLIGSGRNKHKAVSEPPEEASEIMEELKRVMKNKPIWVPLAGDIPISKLYKVIDKADPKLVALNEELEAKRKSLGTQKTLIEKHANAPDMKSALERWRKSVLTLENEIEELKAEIAVSSSQTVVVNEDEMRKTLIDDLAAQVSNKVRPGVRRFKDKVRYVMEHMPFVTLQLGPINSPFRKTKKLVDQGLTLPAADRLIWRIAGSMDFNQDKSESNVVSARLGHFEKSEKVVGPQKVMKPSPKEEMEAREKSKSKTVRRRLDRRAKEVRNLADFFE